MDINYILQLDCREKESKIILQDELRNIKPLSKYESKIPLGKIERCAKVLCSKYDFMLRFYADTDSADKYIIWKCYIHSCKDLSMLSLIYGCTFYECIAKTVVYLNYIKGNY